MHRRHMMAAVVLIACFMAGCARMPDSEERNGVRVAAPDSHAAPDGSSALNGNSVSNGNSVLNGMFTSNGQTESSGRSGGEGVSEILADCVGMRIEQTINAAGGTTLLVSADVNVDGISRVSQYEYLLTDITEEIRADLFEAVFPGRAEQAEYDERNDVWTIDIDPAIRNYFLYLISYSNGGATISGEQILVLENRYYDLYPFEDNRLASVSGSRVGIALDEAADICGRVVDSITDTGDYAVSHIQAYGRDGRRPYLRVVFKRMLDGMPVTTYNDLRFLIDNDGIEKVTGSLFSAREIGFSGAGALLSPREAVEKLQEQAAFLNFDGESSVAVSEITLEYLVLLSPDGKILITPIWRFLIGENEDERNFLCQKILGVDAVTGDLIWEERGETL